MNGQKYLTENDVFAAAPDAASNFWEMHHSRFFKSIFNLEKKTSFGSFFWPSQSLEITQKSLIQHCERSELHLQSTSVTRQVNFNWPKNGKKCQNWKLKCDIFGDFQTLCSSVHMKRIPFARDAYRTAQTWCIAHFCLPCRHTKWEKVVEVLQDAISA